MSEERLEDFRYRMMIRGYMNKKEFQKFMDCGYKTATKLWDIFLLDIEAEGLECIGEGRLMLTKRALGFLGLSEKKIIEAHERA
nr:MAG TPA: hypothetical protein [Caudoviricetes sp.]